MVLKTVLKSASINRQSVSKELTQEDIARLQENLELIQDYVCDIQEHLILLDLIAKSKPRKAKFLLKLFLQNVESHLDDINSLALGSANRLPNTQEL